MDSVKLTAIVSLLIALSVAAERLVEIIKGLVPWLNTENANVTLERLRRCALQVLAVVAGIVTVMLARDAIPEEVVDASKHEAIFALGLLASGGSGFWNTILTYLAKVKDIKEVEAEHKKTTTTTLVGKPGNP
jgi:hypothetical protein